jgi:hypothetical protein
MKRILWIALVAPVLWFAGCGGGGSSSSTVSAPPPTPPPEVAACQTSVLTDLANVTCSRGDATIAYPALSQMFTLTSSGLAVSNVSTDNILVVMDPGGPNAILIGAKPWGSSWQVAAGQTITATINFVVTAPMGKTGLAQLGGSATGDGQVYVANNIFTIPLTVSSITCIATSCPMNNWGVSYVHFPPGSYPANFTFTVTGGTNGTASLQEGSEHFW